MIRYILACTLILSLEAKSRPGLKAKTSLPATYSKPLAAEGNIDAWWNTFKDTHLTTLIERAHKSNPDLAIAQARLLQARSTTQTAKASLLPSATPSLTFTNSQRSNNSPAIPRFDNPVGGAGPDLIPRRYSLFDTSFDVSYEFDFYGSARKLYSATQADEEAQKEDLNDTKLSLTAELARAYFDLREAQARRALSQRNLASFAESLELIQLRVTAGLSNQQDELRLRAQIASTRASLPQLDGTIEQSLLAIALLTGGNATLLEAELGDTAALPALPSQIPGALPSDLLKRRPDIRKAHAQLAAATARRQSADTDWFPKLKLTTSAGGQSGDLTNLLSSNSLISTFSPRLTWGALNYKQTRANIRQKEAKETEQAATIEKTLVAAFKDVETALSQYHRQQDRMKQLQEATAAQGQITQNTRQRFVAGLETFIPVLDSQRSETSALDLEIQSQATLHRNLVTLFKALGGGW